MPKLPTLIAVAATGTIIHPATGEVIDLAEAPTDTIAEARHALTASRDAINDMTADIDQELSARLDTENLRSATVGDWTVTTTAPTRPRWDARLLAERLAVLVVAENLSQAAADAAVVPAPKVVAREAQKLLRHADPVVRAAVAECVADEPQRRRVTARRRDAQ